MAFLKPQSPLSQGDNYFYPLTTSDQVIMDGGYRLNDIVNKVKKSTIMLYANRWSDTKPSVYSIEVKGLSDNVNMKILPHFPEDFEGKQAMKNETAKISFASRNDNVIIFECWDEIPTIDIPIDIEIDIVYPIKGASIEMNYSVIGSLNEPSDPTENMIWINTDQRITDWKFSKYEPKNPKEGMIWFVTGNESHVSFFTLAMNEKEFDEVYPLRAKQYVSGAWADVEAMSYQNGEWVEWIRYIFRSGDGERVPLKVYKQSDVTVTIDDNSITQNFAATGNLIAKIQTENPLSLTDKNVIFARVKCVRKYSTEAYSVRLAISHDAKDDFNGNTEVASAYFQNNSIETVYEIPVTTSGSYYVYIWGVGEYTLYDWWIE